MSTNIDIRIQDADFDLASEYQQLRELTPSVGAVVTFCGLVRDLEKQSVINYVPFVERPKTP